MKTKNNKHKQRFVTANVNNPTLRVELYANSTLRIAFLRGRRLSDPNPTPIYRSVHAFSTLAVWYNIFPSCIFDPCIFSQGYGSGRPSDIVLRSSLIIMQNLVYVCYTVFRAKKVQFVGQLFMSADSQTLA